ncbi:restriction endonuclease subunit S [Bacillus tropicus]|uniref:restriction endonuclease subunit S n=1 Tax=Bacillus tropicus TaxID=2026188 RepID=UPI003D1F5C53
MNKWKRIKLGEILSLTSGKSKTKKHLHQFSEQYQVPVYGGNGINGYTDNILVNEHVIVIGRVGEYCGSVYLTESVSWVTDNALYTKAVTAGTNLKYLYYLLKYNNLGRLRSQSGQPLISQKPIYELEVDFAPKEEQQRIVSILSSVDEAIEKTTAIIQQTEKVKKGLMQQFLTKGIGHTQFKKTNIGEIPEKWEVCELNEVTDVRDGTHDSPKYFPSGIPLVTSKNLKNDGLDFSNISFISESDHTQIEKRSRVDDGDILFGMIGTIGNPVIVEKTIDFSIKNVALIKFTKSHISNIFVKYLLDSDIIQKQFLKGSNGGVQKFIALGTIRKLKIPVPSIQEQENIVSIIYSVERKMTIEKEKLLKLLEIKKGLMQSLLTGKIRVKVDEAEVKQA